MQQYLLIYSFSHILFICFLECYFQVEILRLIRAKSIIWTITRPSIIETWRAFLPIILLKYDFQKYNWQYKNLISNASLEHTWTLVSFFMMKSFRYPATLLPGEIVQLKLNVEVYVYIVKTVCHERSLISNFFMNT